MGGSLSDLKTTIPGLVIAVGIIAALIMKVITFEQFQTFIGGMVSGGLIAVNTKKD